MFHRQGRRGSGIRLAVVIAALLVGALPATASADTPYALGLAGPDTQTGATALDAPMTVPASVPATVDLTPFAPPAGNQGGVNSCAAWAVDYTALGYWENKQGIAGGRLAPMYTYSQLVHGVNTGTYIDDHLTIATQQGVDNRTDYSQGDYDYTNLPTAQETLNAVHWQLSGFTDLPVVQNAAGTTTEQSIEGALAAGAPVVIGLPVFQNFFSVSSANHGYYAGVSGGFAGNHAVTALGYDATGLRIENQWGAGWGENGFATLSWSFVNQYVFQATSVGQLVVSGPAPGVTAAPSVSGTGTRGQTLTGTAGTWTGSPANFQWQWQRDSGSGWTNISGAHGSGYALQSADVNASVRLRIIATNGGGSTPSYSNAVGPVAGSTPAASAAPAVSGTAALGSTLSGTQGTWSGSGNTYAWQWQRDSGSGWANISGAHATSYALTADDVNASVRLRVIATNADGSTASYSDPVGPVSAAAPDNTAAPAISGTARVGSVLASTLGTWTGGGITYVYQWQRDTGSGFVNISGAHGTTYTLAAGDSGARIRLRIIGTNPAGSDVGYSNVSAPVS